MESECKMQRRKPLGEKIFGKLRWTLPCQAKKVPTIFEFAPPKSTTNSQKHETPQELQFSVFFKNKKVRQ